MRLIYLTVLLTWVYSASVLSAEQLSRQGLFRIERNSNDNIIQYDAQITSDGILDSRQPVVAYWIRHAEDGQVKELSFTQRKFAYGFKTKYNARENMAELIMKAKIGRKINVRLFEDRFRALTIIDDHLSYLESIFIQAHGKGISTTVEYMDLRGVDSITGDERFEHVVP